MKLARVVATTKSGHYRHATLDGMRTLCGRAVARQLGAEGATDSTTGRTFVVDCHRCG